MGTVFGKNTTSSSITVAGHKVYYIDSADAEIVEVQDGNNVKYNAFKYTLSGTPYWYVIDGEHDTWTDDLSAWGYKLAEVAYFEPSGSQGISYSGGYVYLYASGAQIQYSEGKTYSCIAVYATTGAYSGIAERSLFTNSGGYLKVKFDGVTSIADLFRIEYTVS